MSQFQNNKRKKRNHETINLGNLEESLPPRPLILLHSGWSACSNLRSPLLPHEN